MEDMLRNIEYLREKADVSYEEAQALLERFEGNVMRALVELEHQGRIYGQPQAEAHARQADPDFAAAKAKAASFWNQAMAVCFPSCKLNTILFSCYKKSDTVSIFVEL